MRMPASGPGRAWSRVALLAALATAVAALAPPASAAPGDPVANGSLQLTLSKGFKRQLKGNHVKLQRQVFTVRKGTIDPTDGSGLLTLNDKLPFKKGTRKRSLERITVTLGAGGALRADGVKLFRLSGGKVDRQGFGAQINDVGVQLVRKGARYLNRKLGLHSLHAGNVGSASVSEQPKTVRVKNGEVRVVPSLDPNGSVAVKLFRHCVNPVLGGVSAIPPAQQDSEMNFIFPVQGGTIGPSGKDGQTLTGGGSQINKDPLQTLGACASVPNDTNIKQTGLQFDLAGNHVFADAVIGGYGPPLGGPKGVAIALDIDKSKMSVDAHPNAGKVTIRGLNLGLSNASIIFLNLVFPNSSGDPQYDFKAGDLFGEATITLNTR
jgi:hypothetical protein